MTLEPATRAVRRCVYDRGMRTILVVLVAVAIGCEGNRAPGGCEPLGQEPSVATIGACKVPMRSLRFATAVAWGGDSTERTTAALDQLIARELLAQGAVEEKLAAPKRAEIEERIATGDLLALGVALPPDVSQDEGVFDFKRFRAFVEGQLGLDVDGFIAEQIREVLAERMRERVGRAAVEGWLAGRCRGVVVREDVAPGYVPCAGFAAPGR